MKQTFDDRNEARQVNISKALSGDMVAYKLLNPIDRMKVNNALGRTINVFDEDENPESKH